MFDGTIKKFAMKLISALEEQAMRRVGGQEPGGLSQQGNAIVAIVLIDMAKILRQVAEIE